MKGNSARIAVLILSTEALFLCGCPQGEEAPIEGDEYRMTYYNAANGRFAAWVEWDGKRYRATLEDDEIVHEEVK